MKNILVILILGFTVLFAGLLFAQTANWTVNLHNAQFGDGTSVTVTHQYSGMSIIALLAAGGVKDETETLLSDITYTGVDSVYAGQLYHQIEPIPFYPDDLVWLSIGKTLSIPIEE